MSQSTHSSLFSDFSPVTMEAWQEKVLKDLKGKPYEKLFWRTADGFEMEPMLVADPANSGSSLPGQAPFTRGSVFQADGPGWQVVQTISAGEGESERISEALEAEVGAVRLEGTYSSNTTTLGLIDLAQTAIHLVPEQLDSAVHSVLEVAGKQNVPPSHVTGTYLSDIVTAAVLAGEQPSTQDLDTIKNNILDSAQLPYFRVLGIDLCKLGDTGASSGLQLAIALASTVEYLDQLSKQSVELSSIVNNLHYCFPVSSSFFMEAAKFRAFRVLIAQCLQAYGFDAPEQLSPFVTAKSSTYQLTHYDKYNNLLRHTTAAMSAVIGGAEAIAIDAFDRMETTNSKTGSRLARNIQFLLKKESYLDQVQDAGGGSYYLEDLTKKLAESAWALFQKIEAEGGLLAYAEAGKLQAILEEQRIEALLHFQERKSSLIGVNQSPNPDETLDISLPTDDTRLAAEFESLRLQVDTIGRKRGKRISAFFWQFGDVRMRNARAQFGRGLLAAGGFAVVDNHHPNDLDNSFEEFSKSDAEILVLCSSDPEYASTGVALIQKARQINQELTVIIAGKPENWEATGADSCVFAGMNAYKLLLDLSKKWA